MKIQELLMNIRNKDFKLNTGLKVKTYLPIEEKKLIAQGIIYECTEEVDGVIELDSVQQYMSYVRFMLKRHTNLDYHDEDYDVLCSTMYGDDTLLNAIFSNFGEDANECSRILNLMLDDYMRKNSIEHTVGRFLDSLNQLTEKLGVKADSFDIKSLMPDNLNVGKLNKFLTDYIK